MSRPNSLTSNYGWTLWHLEQAESPDTQTSNYGWTLWHLEQAESPDTHPEVATHHARLAQARAMLTVADSLFGGPAYSSTWSDDSDG